MAIFLWTMAFARFLKLITAQVSRDDMRFTLIHERTLPLFNNLYAIVEKLVLRGRVSHALNSEVYKQFLKEGIEIPFPQRDVHIKSSLVPAGTN